MRACARCALPADDDARFCAGCGEALVVTGDAPLAAETSAPPAAAAASHTDEGRFLPGVVLAGRYRLVALLGRGGMGEVYRADDLRLGQPVALKFLPPAVAGDAAMLARFYAEVRLGRQVSHPNVVRLYDLVEIDGHHCLAMEYVDGEDLSSLLARIGRLPAAKAVAIARDLGAGLAAAHDKGVIHRDLKPANVMIDGKGSARIADFGIAALAGTVETAEFAGTPAYLAPELLDGAAATVQSDLYALGLVLHEACTGQRLYSPRSLAELKSLQAATLPPSLSSLAPDVPPELERLVARCLDRDPAARPVSAHALLAALPGGNALDAAVAAGETPSPAMVAAAGAVGELRRAVAWSLLLAVAACVALLHAVVDRSTQIGRVAPGKSADVLADNARTLLARLGYAAPATDSAAFFDTRFGVLGTHAATDRDPWTTLRDDPRSPVRFVLRQSPRELYATRTTMNGFTPPESGRVTDVDPPTNQPGMIDVTLDLRGRLLGLHVVPDAAFAKAPAAEPDWPALLDAAGIAPARLAAAPAPVFLPVPTDRTAAWTLADAGAGPALRIEAGALRGRPVWLRIAGPEVEASADAIPVSFRVALWTVLGVSVFTWTAIGLLVRRNLRQGRGDRQGARRLALAMLALLLPALWIRADHVASLLDEPALIVTLLGGALLYAGVLWMLYIALEPVARRRWPTLLVGWSRLLAGRWRDPLVGRDVLVGLLAGIVLALIVHLAVVLPGELGYAWPAPRARVITSLTALRHLVHLVLLAPYSAIVISLGTLVAVLVYRAIVRSRALAIAITGVSLYFMFALFTGIEQVWSLAGALFAATYLAVLMRAGLLAAIAAFAVYLLLEATPLTADFSAWYANRTFFALAVLGALAILAFHHSLGGKPAFGDAFGEHPAGPP
jgi:serine/threonine-protein kinase